MTQSYQHGANRNQFHNHSNHLSGKCRPAECDQYFIMLFIFIHQQRHSFTKNMQIFQRFIDFMCIQK